MTQPADGTCGCFDAPAAADAGNRAGLPAIAYRAATHPDALRRMLARAPNEEVTDPLTGTTRPLKDLAVTSRDEFTVGLLDAWAATIDVLTFYQERIANEGFLRTATERRSVVELGRAIGYEPNPGVAASADLAFTVEDAAGAPGAAVVPAGTKVQSVPAQGKQPQTFETSVAITARAEFNALRPRLTRPQELAVHAPASGTPKLVLMGLSTTFPANAPDSIAGGANPGELFPLDPAATLPAAGTVPAVEAKRVVFVGTNTGLKPGQPVLFAGRRGTASTALVLVVVRVQPEPALGRTLVDLDVNPPQLVFLSIIHQIAVLTLQPLKFNANTIAGAVRDKSWRERDLSAFLGLQGWSGRRLLQHVNFFVPRPPDPPVGVAAGAFGFQTKVGFFGHNAPAHDSIPQQTPALVGVATNWEGWNVRRRYPTATTYYSPAADVYLERSLPDIEPNSWALFEKGAHYTPFWVKKVSDASVAGFTLSAKATGLLLAKPDGTDVADTDADKSTTFTVRETSAHVQSRRLELAALPIEDRLEEGATRLELDRLVLGLEVGRTVIISGERDDVRGVITRQALTLTDVIHNGVLTTLEFENTPLAHPLVRATAAVNANVAPATHGETIAEVLGSGDGSKPFQAFALAKPPLTFVSAASGSGSASTLRVRVNGILWRESPALFGLPPDAEAYIIRRTDDGRTWVRFGDGETAARLPTGAENVTAVYRSGIGLAGIVSADALTLLQVRPLGVRGVTNPLASAGAADPEGRDDARRNVPLTVLTLDRVVSVRDYEDFARAFAGIAKARAALLWDRETRFVHVTVAASAPPATDPNEPGAPAARAVDPASALYRNLVDAVADSHDPAQRFVVATYRPLFFNVRARVLVDAPRHEPAAVLAVAEAAVREAFAFDRREFAQRVTAAEVLTVLQAVPGVVAADLHQLYLYADNQPPPDPAIEQVADVLESRPARLDPASPGAALEAELLLVNPVGITIEEMAA